MCTLYIYNIYNYIHVIMRDEKEGRKKQAFSQSGSHIYNYVMRDEKERRKKQARSTRQSNTEHPRQLLH